MVLKTPVVHIRRTYNAVFTVYAQDLGVIETAFEKVYFDTCIYQLRDIGHGPPVGKPRVGTFRDHDGNLDVRQCSYLDGIEDSL